MEIIDGKDPELWRIAQKRAHFHHHLYTYVIINAFFWLLWYFTNDSYDGGEMPWPVWPMLGWGIGLAFNYFDAYHGDKSAIAKREYDKLKKEKEGK